MEAESSLKWTEELNQRFITVVKDLEGSENASPEAVLKAMGVPDLTLSQIESRLQKHKADQQERKNDIQAIKDDLQAIKDDLQATKNNLQTKKPDLQATRDGLQTKKPDLQATKDDLQTKNSDPQPMQVDPPANQAQSLQAKQTDKSSKNKHGESSNIETYKRSRTSSASEALSLEKPHERHSLAAMTARFKFSTARKEEENKLKALLQKLKEYKEKVREMELKISAQARYIEEMTLEASQRLHATYGVTVIGVQDPSLNLTELKILASNQNQNNTTNLNTESTTKSGEEETGCFNSSGPQLFDLNLLPPLEDPVEPQTTN
ncbi:hypothetical protein NE237_022426 [Protea cynaroides]|uniref:Uncharacterized protein n=1 Tax=Protea cynaroides TaxID=273540 RepID=A0A9Q0HED9_9MAGN|nr:hypothetical protein NE237_022426 [Protea cynaroides]